MPNTDPTTSTEMASTETASLGDRAWTVGAVAETSGLTVRTLHHWDRIGLLRPGRRRVGGRREYQPDDLARLYLILALRALGLDLESIRACLDGGVDSRRVLADQAEALERAARDLAALRARVAAVLDRADADLGEEAPQLLALLAATPPGRAAILDQHLDAEERDALAAAARELGPMTHYVVDIEFPQLYRRVAELRAQGAGPEDDRVQRVVARMAELSALLGGSSGTGGGVRRAWREQPAAMSGQSEETAAPWRDLADFVEAARAVRAGAGSAG